MVWQKKSSHAAKNLSHGNKALAWQSICLAVEKSSGAAEMKRGLENIRSTLEYTLIFPCPASPGHSREVRFKFPAV